MPIFAVKEIPPDEWKKFRDLRLRAVIDSPQAFGDSVEETELREEPVWLNWIQGAHNYAVEVSDTYVALGTFRRDESSHWIINGVWTDPPSTVGKD